MIIVPSVLSNYLTDFRLKMEAAAEFSKRVQIDLVDGKFAPNLTVTPEEAIREVQKYKDGLYLEAHLMLQNPEKVAFELAENGFKKIIIQVESEGPLRDILVELMLRGASCGLALSPQTPASYVEPFLDLLDTVLVLTVNPGRPGQPFISSCLSKIDEVKYYIYERELEVDGGVDENTIGEVVAARADVGVVGSYIFDEGLPAEQYKKLYDVVA